jgi:excisionase family DNA binding protein
MDKLLTVSELAEVLHVAPGSIYHWLSQGRLPAVRFGKRCVRFRQDDIRAFLDNISHQGRGEILKERHTDDKRTGPSTGGMAPQM